MEQLQIIRDLIGKGLQPGKHKSAGPFTLVPLFGGAVTKEYVLAAEALASGQLTITEVPGGSVPELVAHNTGELAALVLDGEHLEGAMQDRVLNISILIPAGRKTILPVSCVEHGRWGYQGRTEFAPSDHMSYSRARMLNLGPVTENMRAGHGARSDQGAVWDEVARKHQEIGSVSDTGAMRDAYSVARVGSTRSSPPLHDLSRARPVRSRVSQASRLLWTRSISQRHSRSCGHAW
jgi:hypothetical protein